MRNFVCIKLFFFTQNKIWLCELVMLVLQHYWKSLDKRKMTLLANFSPVFAQGSTKYSMYLVLWMEGYFRFEINMKLKLKIYIEKGFSVGFWSEKRIKKSLWNHHVYKAKIYIFYFMLQLVVVCHHNSFEKKKKINIISCLLEKKISKLNLW